MNKIPKTIVDYQLCSRCFVNADCAGWEMKDGIIPEDIMYGQFIAGKRNLGRPQLRYRDVYKRDMKELNIDLNK